jgi:amino acid adenylation domain-containing protein
MHPESFAGFRLSPQQARLWAAQADGRPFLCQCAVSVEGSLDPEALHEALRTAVHRHEILRTTFSRRPGMKLPLQVIHEQLEPEWRVAEDKSIETALHEDAARPIDLASGPLLRATLLRLGAGQPALLLTLPALCGDAVSLRTLAAEIVGEQGAEQPLQYADFAEWQTQILEADDDEARAGKRHWAQPHLRAAAPRLLFGAAEVAARAFEPVCVPVPLAADTFATVKALARSWEVSPADVLLACWQGLLARLSGQADVAVGVHFDGRKEEELEGALGLFAQALPVAASVGEQAFSQLARQLAAAVADAHRWQEYALAGSETAETAPRPAAGFEFLRWPALEALSCASEPFTVKLSCICTSDGCRIALHADTAALPHSELQRLAGYFRRLLEGVLREPEAPVDSVDLLDTDARQWLVHALNETTADYPRGRCLHQLFEDQARRTPDRPALACAGRSWTYAEVNARANQLAHCLRRDGIGRNVRVGLYLERSADVIVGLLGILKAGGAYVPLLPGLPRQRIGHQVAEAAAPVLLTQEKLRDELPEGFTGTVLFLDRAGAVAEESTENPEPINCSDDLVYVIYTSGSTGLPKGVAVRHRNLVNYTTFIQGLLRLEASEGLHFATVSTLAADLGNTCVFPSLVSGGCLHVIGYETALSGKAVAAYMAQHPIDVLKITPSHLQALLADGGGAVLPRHTLILGGEASPWDLIRKVRAAGRCAVINHYGPTETTVGSLTYRVPQDEKDFPATAAVPIGRPIANTQVYVLDSRRRPVPQGVPGELVIGGAGVAQGYLNQPEQSAAHFVPHPFAPEGERVYRTGDRVRMLADGAIEFLGRVDRQVKIHGFRVEPGEVEAVLQRHPAVRQAVVVGRTDKSDAAQLAAYLVPAAGETLSVEALRNFLAERLPDYMVPAAFTPLDQLPLNANGKVDVAALPDPEQVRMAGARPFVAPRNPTEEKLAAIWKEVLGVEQVGVDDDFFALGGHSLLATQVISRVQAALGVLVPVRVLFEAPTVARLAEAVTQQTQPQPETQDVDALLAELENLSEEEVQRLLAAEMQQ